MIPALEMFGRLYRPVLPMGHANVDTTLNVYTQVLDGSLREAVEKVGAGLFIIVHKQSQADPAEAGHYERPSAND